MFKAGDKAIISSSGKSQHTLPVGTEVEIVQKHDGYDEYYGVKTKAGKNQNVYGSEMRPLFHTKAEVEAALTKANERVASLKARLSFMEAVGTEEYDEDEFMAYEALTIVEGAQTKLDKARALARVIKSGKF